MPDWEPVIGLEIHVQLKTRTKMFCRCENIFGGEPNTRTCPVCLAHPGALPVPNERAVEWTVKLGLALGCEIAERAVFHRKHYFYPDNPKGYQISQYDEPLCTGGTVVVPGPEGDATVGIVRAHLEEDAAKTIHVGGATGRIVGAAHSNVDFNRGGTPLVEIVTRPDIRSADQAKRFLQLLRQTIVELGISDAEMEKGTLRADANVLNGSAALAALYEQVALDGVDAKAASNVLMNEFSATGVDPATVNGPELGKVIAARARIPREAFMRALAESGDPEFRSETYLGETLVGDRSELEPLVDRILAGNPGQVEAYRGGQEGLLGFFVGQVMKETGGN